MTLQLLKNQKKNRIQDNIILRSPPGCYRSLRRCILCRDSCGKGGSSPTHQQRTKRRCQRCINRRYIGYSRAQYSQVFFWLLPCRSLRRSTRCTHAQQGYILYRDKSLLNPPSNHTKPLVNGLFAALGVNIRVCGLQKLAIKPDALHVLVNGFRSALYHFRCAVHHGDYIGLNCIVHCF